MGLSSPHARAAKLPGIEGTPSGPRVASPVALSAEARIDLCRGLFAFLVVGAHAIDVSRAVHPRAFAALPPALDRLIVHTFEDGIYWVMGFFVISGYCIHLSVGRLMEAERFPLGTYLVARLTRILPLYYAGLLLAVAVEAVIAANRPGFWPNGVDRQSFLSQVLVVQNFTQTFGSFAPSWSITNEVVYYLVYGLLACVAMRRRAVPAWLGMALCVAVASVMQVLYVTIARTPYVLGLGLLCGLGVNWFLGTLVAVHAQALARSPTARALSRLWWPFLAFIVYGRYRGWLWNQEVFLGSGAAFALMLIRFLGTSAPATPVDATRLTPRVARWIGLASYPTYLFHGPLLMLLGSLNLRWGVVSNPLASWVILTASGILSGVVLGFIAERPIMAWRASLLRRLRSGRPDALQSPAAPVLGVPR